MKISIVIPVYNEEKYITKCLECVRKQKLVPDEVLVIDNNCTDKTIELVKQFPFVKIIKEKEQGMIAARNAGFNAAQYEIIARCDADTQVPLNWTKKIAENFSKKKIDALTGPIAFYDAPIKNSLIARAALDLMKQILHGKEVLVGPNMTLTKHMWEKVRGIVCLDDRRVHEDIDLTYHILEVGGVIKRDNRLVVGTSSRRMRKNPYSFFIEYPHRFMKTLLHHDSALLKLKKKFKLPVWYTNLKSQ